MNHKTRRSCKKVIINQAQTQRANAILGKVLSIFPDGRGHLIIEFQEIDAGTGFETGANFMLSVNLYGLMDKKIGNYSVGGAFGAVLTAFGDSNGNLDIMNLVGNVCLAFVHFTYSPKNNKTYENLMDIFPIVHLQFPWLDINNEGR